MSMHFSDLSAELAEALDTQNGGPLATDGAAGSPPAGAGQDSRSIAAGLSSLAAGMDRRFVEAGTMLMTAIETIDRLMAVLKDISSALDDTSARDAIATLTDMAERLGSLPDTLQARELTLDAARSHSETLEKHLVEMRRLLDVLRIYGLNIKIAAGGGEGFIKFVDDLNLRLDGGLVELDGIGAMLDRLAPDLKEAGSAIDPLRRECERVVPAVPQQLAADAASLQQHMQSMSELARDIFSIAGDIQREVATVLGALQVGDSTRQRVEHVVETLEILDGWSADAAPAPEVEQAVRSSIYAILAGQLVGAAEDFSAGANTLLRSLQDIGPHTTRLLSVIETDGGSNGPQILQEVERSIIQMDDLTDRLQTTEEQSGRLVEMVASTLAGLDAKLQVLHWLRVDLRNIAMNTSLLCRRSGDTGRAVLVVAKEIDVLCNQLGEELDETIHTIRRLSSESSSIQEERPRDLDDGGLGGALEIVQKGCSTNDAGLEQGRADASHLIELLNRTGTDLADELALEEAMLSAGDGLSALARGAPEPCEAALDHLAVLLPQIAKLYSMAQERDIHRAFSPIPEPVVDDLDADDLGLFGDDDDDEDDGLF
ncbi:hypothetical protein [Novosphingopyxis sp. YJ-S2-01]|uniref:hypothetical protein n=1 Tax=Novosphingopyxis sp. YJ-S2-01 TaxID=2794021 RepID=UPI0018DB2DC9|nr:hypothetical protein [Novosphingopyxis sp. YJ-S2-01]MBH9536715.1 hypothetical protein [Novosphingopyxis sp. YJ-S2-01]